MSGAFKYRPKFVDIRVRPPKPEEAGKTDADEAAREDVFTLKPGQKRCEWPGCLRPGENRAPKSRDMLHEHYWFCQPHAAEYNRNWDFFSGMSEDAVRRFQEDALTGHRPTWSMKADARSREAAAFAAKMGTANAKPGWDPFDLFARNKAAQAAPEVRVRADGRRLGKLERAALADLDLDDMADAEAIRARYKELVKRCHPDSNGGDRSAEAKLQRVLKAYKTLKAAKIV